MNFGISPGPNGGGYYSIFFYWIVLGIASAFLVWIAGAVAIGLKYRKLVKK